MIAPMLALSMAARDFQASDMERVLTWQTAVRVAAQNPVIGVGPDGFEDPFRRNKPDGFERHIAANAHNDFLQVAATLGSLGLIAYTIFCVQAYKVLSGPALGALVALFVNAKVNPVPLEAMVLGAVILGVSSGPVSTAPMLARGALLLLAAGIIGIVVPVAFADYYAGRGDVASVFRAARTNPYELTYKLGALSRGAAEFNRNDNYEVRGVLIRSIREQVASAKQHRPNAEVTKQILDFGTKMDNRLR